MASVICKGYSACSGFSRGAFTEVCLKSLLACELLHSISRQVSKSRGVATFWAETLPPSLSMQVGLIRNSLFKHETIHCTHSMYMPPEIRFVANRRSKAIILTVSLLSA